MNRADIKGFLQSKKAVSLALVIGAIGILLIAFSDFGSTAKNSEDTNKISDDEYRIALEASAKELICSITGDKDAQVYISLSTSTEYVYAKEEASNKDIKQNKESIDIYNNETSDKKEESYIIINTDNGEQPLLISAIAPQIRGVAVVAEGADDSEKREAIISALSVFLDVSERDISVIGKKY